MSVNLVQFPLTVTEWTKNVAYLTDIIVGRNGQEVRNAIWQDPLHKFNAAFSVKTYDDIAVLVNFFHAMRGREQAFLVKDWADFQVDSWTPVKETIGGTFNRTFQLYKRYSQTIGGVSSNYDRTLKYIGVDPDTSAPKVTVQRNGANFTNFTVNTSTGVVTLGGTQTGTWTFQVQEFYTPVRFDIDELPIELMSYWVQSGADRSNVTLPDIPLVEVRV